MRLARGVVLAALAAATILIAAVVPVRSADLESERLPAHIMRDVAQVLSDAAPTPVDDSIHIVPHSYFEGDASAASPERSLIDAAENIVSHVHDDSDSSLYSSPHLVDAPASMTDASYHDAIDPSLLLETAAKSGDEFAQVAALEAAQQRAKEHLQELNLGLLEASSNVENESEQPDWAMPEYASEPKPAAAQKQTKPTPAAAAAAAEYTTPEMVDHALVEAQHASKIKIPTGKDWKVADVVPAGSVKIAKPKPQPRPTRPVAKKTYVKPAFKPDPKPAEPKKGVCVVRNAATGKCEKWCKFCKTPPKQEKQYVAPQYKVEPPKPKPSPACNGCPAKKPAEKQYVAPAYKPSPPPQPKERGICVRRDEKTKKCLQRCFKCVAAAPKKKAAAPKKQYLTPRFRPTAAQRAYMARMRAHALAIRRMRHQWYVRRAALARAALAHRLNEWRRWKLNQMYSRNYITPIFRPHAVRRQAPVLLPRGKPGQRVLVQTPQGPVYVLFVRKQKPGKTPLSLPVMPPMPAHLAVRPRHVVRTMSGTYVLPHAPLSAHGLKRQLRAADARRAMARRRRTIQAALRRAIRQRRLALSRAESRIRALMLTRRQLLLERARKNVVYDPRTNTLIRHVHRHHFRRAPAPPATSYTAAQLARAYVRLSRLQRALLRRFGPRRHRRIPRQVFEARALKLKYIRLARKYAHAKKLITRANTFLKNKDEQKGKKTSKKDDKKEVKKTKAAAKKPAASAPKKAEKKPAAKATKKTAKKPAAKKEAKAAAPAPAAAQSELVEGLDYNQSPVIKALLGKLAAA